MPHSKRVQDLNPLSGRGLSVCCLDILPLFACIGVTVSVNGCPC